MQIEQFMTIANISLLIFIIVTNKNISSKKYYLIVAINIISILIARTAQDTLIEYYGVKFIEAENPKSFSVFYASIASYSILLKKTKIEIKTIPVIIFYVIIIAILFKIAMTTQQTFPVIEETI